ncbi:MAG TPA: Gfo/Idh/MocA family oxidoreductase, partial [Actinomycetota bacterium]|nr:Gfo/Idh/MocA family oxidoreductase [Actinomycetota bacterium]
MAVRGVAVGLVGAGPWAGMLHAPMLAGGPETTLAGVWARRPEAARALAEAHGSRAVASLEELWDVCEAVAFAVPPDVQAEVATAAARAGKHLLLDKPVALTVAAAEELAEVVGEAGVVSQLVLTNRYGSRGRRFLAEAEGFEVVGARCASLSGALLPGSPFATPWRLRHGALLDVGPHLFDLLEGAVGPIEELSGRGDPLRWVSLTCRHAGGQVSELSMSLALPLAETVFECVLYGPAGSLALRRATDPASAGAELGAAAATLRREFAAAVTSG